MKYIEFEKESESFIFTAGPVSDDKEIESYSGLFYKIRNNFLCLGKFRRGESKYLEAYSFYLCAHNMAPSLLSAFRALHSFCYYIKYSNYYKKEHKLTNENKETVLDCFNECLKIANAKQNARKEPKWIKKLIENIQKDIIEKIDENKADVIFNGISFGPESKDKIVVKKIKIPR